VACATPMPPVAHCRTGRLRGEQGRDAEATPRRARHTTLFPLPLVDVTQALPSSLACPPSATRRHALPSVVPLWRKQRKPRCDATLCSTPPSLTSASARSDRSAAEPPHPLRAPSPRRGQSASATPPLPGSAGNTAAPSPRLPPHYAVPAPAPRQWQALPLPSPIPAQRPRRARARP
jgi:hypothetical protein